LRKNISLISIFTLIVFIFHCNKEIRSYVESKNTPLKIYLEPTRIEIDIYFLRSISSLEVEKDRKEEIIKQVSLEHAEWFQTNLKKNLMDQGMEITPKDTADIILESAILDMGEVRPKKFIEGLSVGLVLGAIIGELTGDPQVGLAVFVWEVIEEIIIVYLLKSYFMVTTIGLTVKQTDGAILGSKEFTSYSNKEYEKNLPEEIRSLRENKVRGSLEQNAKDIVEFLKKEENKK